MPGPGRLLRRFSRPGGFGCGTSIATREYRASRPGRLARRHRGSGLAARPRRFHGQYRDVTPKFRRPTATVAPTDHARDSIMRSPRCHADGADRRTAIFRIEGLIQAVPSSSGGSYRVRDRCARPVATARSALIGLPMSPRGSVPLSVRVAHCSQTRTRHLAKVVATSLPERRYLVTRHYAGFSENGRPTVPVRNGSRCPP